VGDDNAISPYQLLSEKSLRTDLSELIDDLEVLEGSIIKMRFGIEADSPSLLKKSEEFSA
jgi:DNA-directed RNA polymerase sigma subunit (sigma70/sigma32)